MGDLARQSAVHFLVRRTFLGFSLKVCNIRVSPNERSRVQLATHSAVFVSRRRSRMTCGALTTEPHN